MDDLEAYDRAQRHFAGNLAKVSALDWDTPTPCGGWTVGHVVSHVIGGERMSSVLLDGGTAEEARAAITGSVEMAEAASAYEAATLAARERFGRPGALEIVVHHPMLDMPGAQLLGFRITDLTVHGWDVARAIGVDETIDAELVEANWEKLEPLSPFIGTIGVFGDGPSGEVGADAPLQTRMLDLTGRRP